MNYDAWFIKVWNSAGGLITQTTAAKILHRTTGRIAQMITEGKLTAYRYSEKEPILVSFAEICHAYEAQDQARFFKSASECLLETTKKTEELADNPKEAHKYYKECEAAKEAEERWRRGEVEYPEED